MKRIFEDTKYAIGVGIAGLSIVALFLAVFIITKTVTEIRTFGTNVGYTDSISIDGVGEVTAVPNIATFSFTIEENGESSELAQKQANEKYAKAVEYLKSKGIEDKDIKSTGPQISPKYEWQTQACFNGMCPGGKNTLVGYQVFNTTTVKVRKAEDSNTLITDLTAMGISNVSGVTFTIEDDEILRDQAREKAIANAKSRAEKMAKELDVKLGKVISFSEDTGEEPRPYYGMGGDMMEAKISVVPEINPGENTITSRVYISYQIK